MHGFNRATLFIVADPRLMRKKPQRRFGPMIDHYREILGQPTLHSFDFGACTPWLKHIVKQMVHVQHEPELHLGLTSCESFQAIMQKGLSPEQEVMAAQLHNFLRKDGAKFRIAAVTEPQLSLGLCRLEFALGLGLPHQGCALVEEQKDGRLTCELHSPKPNFLPFSAQKVLSFLRFPKAGSL